MESYDLESAAERLGWDLAALQDRLRSGAFPGRFLVATSGGTEMRIPRVDVDREVNIPRAVTTAQAGALSVRDDDALVQQMRRVLAEDRAHVVQQLEEAFRHRDSEISALRGAVDELRTALQVLVPPAVLSHGPGSLASAPEDLEVDDLLRDIRELESLLEL